MRRKGNEKQGGKFEIKKKEREKIKIEVKE
jgi:hypothetical protein